jgi:hypothetical protein
MSKFIGLVSAYAYAQSKGYTGTEEEFAILMAEYASVTETAVEAVRIATESARSAAAASSDVNRAAATVAQQAAQVHDDAETSSESATTASEAKETAVAKADEASGYAQTATDKAGEAQQSAQTATVKAGEAAQSASAAAESARTLTIDATLTQSGQAADAKEVGDAVGTVSDGYVPLFLIDDTRIANNGVETYYAGWSSTGFIPIDSDGLTISTSVQLTYNAFYGDDKAFLTGGKFTVPAGISVITPMEGAKYIRLSSTTSNMQPVKIYGRSAKNASEITDVKKQLSQYKPLKHGNVMPALSEWITGRVYNGVYSNLDTIRCTDYIPVEGGKTYYIYGGYISQEYFGVYNDSKELIPGWSFDSLNPLSTNKSTATITLDSNAAYIRINAFANKMDAFPADAYISQYPSYLPKTFDFSDLIPRAKGSGTLADKKILVIGDSISTDIYGSYKKWVTYLCESGFFSNGNVTNNSYHATGYVAVYTEGGVVKKGTFKDRITALGDLTGYDTIITFGGINDWIQSVPFADFTAAVDSYYEYLAEHATQARIAVIAPLRTALYGTQNSVGKTQKDYSDYIKSAASEYSLPVLNLTDEGGFYPNKSASFRDMWTFLPDGYTAHDGVHPTTEWERKHLAPQISWFLAGLM